MSEKEYAPLSAACVRALQDKLYDKRKAAALEIEKMVRDFEASNNQEQTRKLLKVLGQDFTLSHNPNSRKGGLIGLAAVAIALESKNASSYVDGLVRPILACFSDTDSRVRYYACEALYNVLKAIRHDTIPIFYDVFDALSKLAADPDQSVRNGAELLDRLLKDIVTETPSFDVPSLIPLLRERIYTKNPFARQFVVSWINLLDSVPDIDMIPYLPQLLDGLMIILSDPQAEIRRMCEVCLAEFLYKIIRNPRDTQFAAMVNVLVVHAQSTEQLVQFTAIIWLKEFVSLAKPDDILPYTSGILIAILPCLEETDAATNITTNYSNDEETTTRITTAINIREFAKTLNFTLMQLVTQQIDPSPLTSADPLAKPSETTDDQFSKSRKPPFDISSVVNVLCDFLKKKEGSATQTKIAVLRWVFHLHSKMPQQMTPLLESDLFTILLETLSDPSDEVVLLDLEVLAQVFTGGSEDQSTNDRARGSLSETYFTRFMLALLHLFNSNKVLLQERGAFIIRQLCLLMNAQEIYASLAQILLDYQDLNFAYTMVQTLNSILFTSSELLELRTLLRDMRTDESRSLFRVLYHTWCHSPVATLSLCLLSRNYAHACDLIKHFVNLDITEEFLCEMDQLVQLIESPIFASLRLNLLDCEENEDLIKSLYGLLMLLPQTESFNLLSRRLQCVPQLRFSRMSLSDKKAHNPPPQMDFEELLRHFNEVQEKHKRWRRSNK